MLRYVINPRKTVTPGYSESTMDVGIHLNSHFGLGLNGDELANEKFFERIKDSVLPKITDIEKIPVYPAVVKYKEDGEVLSLANEIEINLHFRRRWDYYDKEHGNYDRIITDGWSTNDVFGWTTGKTGDDETERQDLTDYDEKSDLIGYLGFTDDDIYYQKSKVKKSFLRLMFYDSNRLTNKNLLAYSTAFLDAGKLFTKYSLIRNNTKLYESVGESENYENEMVLFEPGSKDEKYDKLRISSRITLKDRYQDDASSDGFYIYLFRDDMPLEKPIDLYLKAEFNNAKYGKTIDFMLPIGEEGIPIRFKDDDFPTDFIKEDDNGKQNFDFERYYNSLFVNVKCRYCKELGKYVYYFPWDDEKQNGYQVSNDSENKKITLNFFEPRLNKLTESN